MELCDAIDTTRYRYTKWYRSTSSFGIVGIDYANNQTVDDCGSHFGSNLLHRISINVIKIVTSCIKSMKRPNFICTLAWLSHVGHIM